MSDSNSQDLPGTLQPSAFPGEPSSHPETLHTGQLWPSCGPASTDLNEGTARTVLGPVLPVIPGYEILDELGRGGMGVVYKAKHLALKRLVAMKMILAGSYAGEEDLKRFRIEAEAIAHLKHPNIIQVYEIGEAEGRPYFSLEYIEEGSLAARLGGADKVGADKVGADNADKVSDTMKGGIGKTGRCR
jgi:serine/threonine protein kinase